MGNRNETIDRDLHVAAVEHANPVAERLRAAIRKAGGNNAVSERSGVPLSTIGRYLAGYDMKLQSALALTEACDVTVDWLVTGKEAPAAAVPVLPASGKPPALFSIVDMDMMSAAIEGAQSVFAARGAPQKGRPFAQIVCLLYDEGRQRLGDMQAAGELPNTE